MEELYKNYSKLVFNYLRSLCGDKELAEELTQETFYKAIKGINKFKGECKVSSWLCQIARNTWINYRKKEDKVKYISYDEDENIKNILAYRNVEDDVDARNELISVYKKIHKLDEKTKEVFYLRIKGELSFKEIGEILNKSEEWARITFYRGKIKLKEEIENDKK